MLKGFFDYLTNALGFYISLFKFPSGKIGQIKVFDQPHNYPPAPHNYPQMTINPQEVDVMARTIWGEARNEGERGMHGVANVIMNRIKLSQQGGSYRTLFGAPDAVSVCRKPYQFSCWNAGDPNLPQMQNVTLSNPQFVIAYNLATRALSGTLPDITGGATHYLTKAAYNAHQQRPKGGTSWSSGEQPKLAIASHLYFDYNQTLA